MTLNEKKISMNSLFPLDFGIIDISPLPTIFKLHLCMNHADSRLTMPMFTANALSVDYRYNFQKNQNK